MGAGSQQGVCLDCIKKLQAAKRARESGRTRPSSRRAAAESAKRESVRTFTCVDCGERFFDVDLAEKRVQMVDGQPVCVACLRKRTGMGLMPIFIGSGLVILALLYMYPLQMLVALGIGGICVAIAGASYQWWPSRTRGTLVAGGLGTVVVVIVAHMVVSGHLRHVADAEAMEAYYADCQKAHKENNPLRLKEAIDRAEAFAKGLNYPAEQKGAIARWKKKLTEDQPVTDPLDQGIYWVLVDGYGREPRWGKQAIKSVTHERNEEGGVSFEVEMYASKHYKDPEHASYIIGEMVAVLRTVMLRPMRVDKVVVTFYVVEGGEDREIARYGLDRDGYTKWFQETIPKADGTREGPLLRDYCEPKEWRP